MVKQMSYSQYGEDQIIAAEFLRQESAHRFFLDIGAWHPTIFSNTRLLIEQGWSGVIIEPSPGPFMNLMRACLKCGDVPIEQHMQGPDGITPIPADLCGKCGSIRYGSAIDRLILILAGVSLEPGLVWLNATNDALSTSSEAE